METKEAAGENPAEKNLIVKIVVIDVTAVSVMTVVIVMIAVWIVVIESPGMSVRTEAHPEILKKVSRALLKMLDNVVQ